MSATISLYRNEDTNITNAYENAVLNLTLSKDQNGYKAFVLCGCEPGVGTTSTVVELAISLALAGSTTIILDGDLKKENDYKKLNDDLEYGLVDYIKDDVEIDKITFKTSWDNLEYIPCGNLQGKNKLQMLYSPKIKTLVEYLKTIYDYVLIDAPAISSSLDSVLLAMKSDAVILVSALNGSKKKNLEFAMEQIKDSGANLIGVIQNKVSMKEYRQYASDYDYYNNHKFLKKKISMRKEKNNVKS